jgi:hypothetical protein
MNALANDSAYEVQKVLKDDPNAAERIFFDHEFEPPLVFATRSGCSAAVMRLLLKCQAPVNASDIYGRPALSYIGCLDHSRAPWVWDLPPEPRPCLSPDAFELVALLLEAGANPHLQDHQGQTPVSGARQKGLESLACFLENYVTLHAYSVLRGRRALANCVKGLADSNVDSSTGAEQGVQGLSDEMLWCCCSFLAP